MILNFFPLPNGFLSSSPTYKSNDKCDQWEWEGRESNQENNYLKKKKEDT